jgi:PPE-repeat protein
MTVVEGNLMADFGALPPEINSARMYAGPGSSPLLASAAAWDALAAELDSFGAGYSGAISALQSGSWSGAASTAMATAAATYVAWVTTTAGQAAEAASRARSAATAYDAAFAATVPPSVVLANRVLLATLVATNLFGQNTPAIAATEAGYAEMWAQDSAAMYGYALSASTAATLGPFSEPPQTTNPAGRSAQGVAVGQSVNAPLGHSQTTLSQLMSTVPQRLQTLGSGRFTESSPAPDSANLPETDASTTSTSTSASTLTAVTDLFRILGATVPAYAAPKTVFQGGSFVTALPNAQASDFSAIPAPTRGAATTAQTCSPTSLSDSVLAGVGRAAPVGQLSVPPNWTSAKPAATPTAEPAAAAKTSFRALPSWASSTNVPGIGQLTTPENRRSNAVFRMRDRRYRMPRPLFGG